MQEERWNGEGGRDVVFENHDRTIRCFHLEKGDGGVRSIGLSVGSENDSR